MVAPLGARVAQADEKFVGLQDKVVALLEQGDSLPQSDVNSAFFRQKVG